jgi:rod shape-determining protein MreB
MGLSLSLLFNKLFANTLYVQIRKNAFRLRHIESKTDQEIAAPRSFTTTRLLVGQFQEAESLLKKAMRGMGGAGLLKASPVVVIHPMEMVEGGLSEVEERAYRELAMGAGARKVFVHVGAPLADSEVMSVTQCK